MSVTERFVEDLVQVRQLAGRPSYSTLERLSSHHLRRATMSDVLNGNRVNLPDWRFVHEFVAACRAAATENRLDANKLGTVADWKRHWDGAARGFIDARFPGHGSTSFGKQKQATVPQPEASVRVAADLPEPAPGEAVRRPSIWGPVPPRLPDFVGRESWLERLRQAFTRDERAGVVAIQGMFGVGKTQLAIEYANRYAHEYDMVWWVPCDDKGSAPRSMAELADRVGIAAGREPDAGREPEDGDLAGIFDLLRRRERYARWLLIFDNATEPEDISGLIPPLSGDVIVTTRSGRWEASGELLELDAFDRSESIEFLRRRMGNFTDATAHRLAEGVGDLPLLLEHAVESHIEVDVYLARLEEEPLRLLGDQPADYHASIAKVWQTTVESLRVEAPDALDLLCCLAFFGADQVPRESLERGSHLAGISIHPMLRDPIRLAGAIAKLRRSGLLRVEPGTRRLATHRVTRCMARDLIATSAEAEEEHVRHDVHLLLAAADLLMPDDPATWPSYEELRGRAVASGIIGCREELVGNFVVNLVRYLNAAGDPRAALTMAGEALAGWDPELTDCRVRMRAAMASALFAVGSHSAAFQSQQDALAAMRSDPARWRAEIIEQEGMSGARYRIAGNFRQALAADQESVRAHVAEFGEDDPRTFNAVNSLIADLALSGSGAAATAAAHSLYHSCFTFYSDAGHPVVLAARNVLGRCRWLSGDYREAASIMGEVHVGYDEPADGRTLGVDHPWRLGHEIDYAIARRDGSLMPADLPVLAHDAEQVHRRCWRTLGADHPQTLAATVVLGSILRRIDGRTSEAISLLEEAEGRYRLSLPDHPFSHACRAFLASVRGQAGTDDPQRAAARSVRVIQDMVEQLADSAGDEHPLSLITVSALANALARAGELDAALKYGQQAQVGFRELVGPAHPHTLAVEANTAAIQSRMATASDASLHSQLIEIDFTPLPL